MDKKEMERTYNKPDPFGYRQHPDDKFRKDKILSLLKKFKVDGPYDRALDIGAGEGWITQDLPALEIHAYEFSEQARKRIPKPVQVVDKPHGKYDLIVATGILYGHYDHKSSLKLIEDHASNILITSHVKHWEKSTEGECLELADPEYILRVFGMVQMHYEEFPYRVYTQRLRVFRKTDATST